MRQMTRGDKAAIELFRAAITAWLAKINLRVLEQWIRRAHKLLPEQAVYDAVEIADNRDGTFEL